MGKKESDLGSESLFPKFSDIQSLHWVQNEEYHYYRPESKTVEPVRHYLQYEEEPISSSTSYPYSEESESFRFECPNRTCRRMWYSPLVNGQKHQPCKKCGSHAYPEEMWETEEEEDEQDSLPPPPTRGLHERDLCQRCIEGGDKCYAGLRLEREELLEAIQELRVRIKEEEEQMKRGSKRQKKGGLQSPLMVTLEKRLEQIDALMVKLRSKGNNAEVKVKTGNKGDLVYFKKQTCLTMMTKVGGGGGICQVFTYIAQGFVFCVIIAVTIRLLANAKIVH